MAQPLTATLPEWLVLDAGYTITLDAVDPATGAPVAGVVVSAATISSAQSETPPLLPPEPEPLLTHEVA